VWGYPQTKGPFSEQEIRQAQVAAGRFQQGEIEVRQGKLLAISNYFFLGNVYTVETPQGAQHLVSFITPDPPLQLATGGEVEWVGVGDYAAAMAQVTPTQESIDGEIISLERISPKNNSYFYSVVHSLTGSDQVRRFIIDKNTLNSLMTLNSVRVIYRSPGENQIQLISNGDKVARGFVRDLWLTSKIKGLELERNFDFAKYPYYMTVAPGANPKYTWTFFLTKEQKAQVQLGNVVEVHYDSVFPKSITVTQASVDPRAAIQENGAAQ